MITPVQIAFASLALMIAATGLTQAAAWQAHQYQTDGFAVEFSANVKVSPIAVNETTQAKMVRATSYLQDGGGAYAYLVGASLFKDDALFDFAAGVIGTMKSYKCRMIDSDTTTKQMGNLVREVRGSQCMDGTARVGARFVLADKWFYQVVYLVSRESDRPDAEYFLQSFRLTRR